MSMTTTLTGTGWKADIDGVAPVWVAVPASATASGIRGQMAVDATFVYFCVAVNTWVRAAVATW